MPLLIALLGLLAISINLYTTSFALSSSSSDTEILVTAPMQRYPGLAEHIKPYVGHLYYCRGDGYAPGDCNSYRITSAHHQNRKWNLVPQPRYGLEHASTKKKLRFWLPKREGEHDDFIASLLRSDASACVDSVEIVHDGDANSNDLFSEWWTDGGIYRAMGKARVMLSGEPWDIDFKRDGVESGILLQFNRKSADVWYSYWPGEYGANCDIYSNPRCLFFPEFVNMTYANELKGTRDSIGALFISDCEAHFAATRSKFVEELAKYIKMDSYGGCTITGTVHVEENSIEFKKLIPGIENPSKYMKKVAVTSTYRFSLGFENNINEDYLSEKFYHALWAGNVPLIFGAPNVDEYSPFPLSFINCLDFASPKILAEYIKFLNSNEEFYQKYMKGKDTKTLSDSFISLHTVSSANTNGANSTFCRIVAEYKRRYLSYKDGSYLLSSTHSKN
jgi:hypothetical protein